MYCMKIVAVVVAFATVFARGCELNEIQLQKDVMECVSQHPDPQFMLAIAEHMQNPDAMAKPTFICDYQKAIIDIVLCMKDKVQGCLPKEYSSVMAVFPSKTRLEEGMKFMCDHKDLLKNQCMNDHIEEFMGCYMGKVNQLKAEVMGTTNNVNNIDMKGLVCSVVRSEEQCLRENKGSCSKEFMDIMIQMLEKFFPMTSCTKSTNLADTILRNILIHGEPQGNLRFKPNKYQPYVIKN